MPGDSPLAPPTDGFRSLNPRFTEFNFTANIAKLDAVRQSCAARGWSNPAAALAWVLSRGHHLILIPGTSSATHIAQFAQARDIPLSPEDHAEIDRLLPAGSAAGDRYADHRLLAIERYC